MPIILEEHYPNNFYIRMESDFDSTMTGVSLESIGIIEQINTSSPAMVLHFTDMYGDLFNHTRFSMDAVYELFIGLTPETAIQFKFKMAEFRAVNSVSGKAEAVLYRCTFISELWEGLVKDTHSRGWKQSTYSDVIENILADAGIVGVEVEPSDGEFDVIQPDWTNTSMIDYLTRRMTLSNQAIPSYQYSFGVRGTFWAKSLDTLYSQPIKHTYSLSNNDEDRGDGFAHLSIKTDFAGISPYSLGGATAQYFDFDTKQFITEVKNYSKSNQSQISDFSVLPSSHESDGRKAYGGRSKDIMTTTEHSIIDGASALVVADITTQANTDISTGDMIELIIPPTDNSTTSLSEKYSGTWMVTKHNLALDYPNKLFRSHITLARSGINGIDLNGLVTTVTGKSIA